MTTMPKEVQDLINDKEAVKVLVTASGSGRPHAIVAGTISAPSPDTVVIGQVLFSQTAKNLAENGKAAFLVVKGHQSYEVNVNCKGAAKEGPALEDLNRAIAPMNLHANALWSFEVCCVSEQGANSGAGKRIARGPRRGGALTFYVRDGITLRLKWFSYRPLSSMRFAARIRIR